MSLINYRMGKIAKYIQLYINSLDGSNKSIPIANWNLENAFRHRKYFYERISGFQ